MDIAGVLVTIKNILNSLIPVIVSLGIVYFVWGVVAYVIAGGEDAKKKGKDRIVYGIIALAIIVSVWGIVNMVVRTFNIGGANPTFVSTEGTTCDTSEGILVNSKPPEEKFRHAAGYVTCTIRNSIIPFLFALALTVFVWGVVKFFIINSDEEAKRSQGKQFMIWGLLALTVMLSVWGLVKILGDTFGIDSVIPYTVE